MNVCRALLSMFLVGLTPLLSQERPTLFQPDSASSYLRVLSEDIGPRPMGSPAERKAMQFAVEKFEAFGLDQAYVLPFRIAPSLRGSSSNTNSGTAVGVLHGTSDRIIVIGAHIDSYSPEGPGANDDGSGSAVVIELARAMAQKEWESTLVFCLFGGEESGLKGSYHFVEAFADIDKVALMLQVDMANGSDWLLPWYETREITAPGWLVHAAYEEFERLGYKGLRYPTHFFALNSTIGSASSDHEPFLRRNIPAIDFTTDITDPIHTPQDTYENFQPWALERSGDLVYRLTERFDQGVPEEKTGAFKTVQIGTNIYLLPFWFLHAMMIVAWVISIWTLVQLRGRRKEKRGETRPRVPGLKIFLLTAIAVVGTVFFEDVLSLFSGYRSPWFSDPSAMIPVSLSVAAFLSLLLSRLAPKLDLSSDEYRYALRAVVTLIVYSGLAALANPRLAAYPAVGLFFISLAFIARRGLLAVILVVLGAYPMMRLLTTEVHDLMSRMFAQTPPGVSAVVGAIFLIFEGMLLLMPFVLAFAGVIRSREKTWPALPLPLSHPAWLAATGIAVIVFSGMVLSSDPYNDVWRQNVEVTQEASSSADGISTTVKSPEYLDGARIMFAGSDTVIASGETVVLLPTVPFDQKAWLQSSIDRADSTTGNALVSINTLTRPYTLEVRYTTQGRSRGTRILDASAGLASLALSEGNVAISYYSFPDTSIILPLSLTLNEPDTVRQTIVATFADPAVPTTVEKEYTTTKYRTIVQETTTFYVDKVETTGETKEDETEGAESD